MKVTFSFASMLLAAALSGCAQGPAKPAASSYSEPDPQICLQPDQTPGQQQAGLCSGQTPRPSSDPTEPTTEPKSNGTTG